MNNTLESVNSDDISKSSLAGFFGALSFLSFIGFESILLAMRWMLPTQSLQEWKWEFCIWNILLASLSWIQGLRYTSNDYAAGYFIYYTFATILCSVGIACVISPKDTVFTAVIGFILIGFSLVLSMASSFSLYSLCTQKLPQKNERVYAKQSIPVGA